MEKQVKKLTVKDIVEECQITRQVFYYHFEDIPAMFRWMLGRNGEKLVDEALTQESAELRQMLFDGCYRFFKQVAFQGNVAERYPAADVNLFLRYHCHAIIGILQEWTDDDTRNVDQIAHVLNRFIEGSLSAGLRP